MARVLLTLQQFNVVREAVLLFPETFLIAIEQGEPLLERQEVTFAIFDEKMHELDATTLNPHGRPKDRE